MTGTPRFPALTAIRGLAAWWVVAYHMPVQVAPVVPPPIQQLAASGYLAVDLFFILSGFVIALNYHADFRIVAWQSVLGFYHIRLARIYPLHLVMLLATLAVPMAFALAKPDADLGNRYDPTYFLLSLVLMQNWGITDHLGWNIPAWSISTEWAAYLAFPFIIRFALHYLRTPLDVVATALCLAATLAVAVQATSESLGGRIESFGLVRCLLEFAIGVALFRLWAVCGVTGRLPAALALAAVALLGALSFTLTLPDYVIFPLLFALLIYALTAERSLVTRCLSAPPLQWLGSISFSTYMVHFCVKDWTKLLLVRDDVPLTVPLLCYFVTTLIASIALYYCVELPGGRFLRGIRIRRQVRL